MVKLHLHLPAQPENCGYLAGREATLEYRLMTEVSPEELKWLIIRGWRRFGAAYFRPVCAGCLECVSLRVPVNAFAPTKSQRRALRKCEDLRMFVRKPIA